MNALLITDNVQDEVILSQMLRLAGVSASTEHRLATAVERWTDRPADLLLVALRLSNPLQAVYEIRRVAIVPLILIIDFVTEDRHLELMEAGADWVIERPYNVRLLISYTKMLLRRSAGVINRSLPVLHCEEIRLDPSTRTVHVAKRPPQRLSLLEFRLLHTLMVHRGQVLPTETLVKHVWGYAGEGDRSLVRDLVSRIRTKIERIPGSPRYIRTVSTVGYTFAVSQDD